MGGHTEARRFLTLLLALTLATGVGFVVAIVANPTGGVLLHEIAASLLLTLLLLAIWPASVLRSVDSRPVVRVLVALTALVVAAIAGASLAAGALAGGLAGIPLVPLAVMLATVADGLRVTQRLRTGPVRVQANSDSQTPP